MLRGGAGLGRGRQDRRDPGHAERAGDACCRGDHGDLDPAAPSSGLGAGHWLVHASQRAWRRCKPPASGLGESSERAGAMPAQKIPREGRDQAAGGCEVSVLIAG